MSSLNSRHARVYIRHLTSQIVLIGLVGVVTLCPESTRASIERDSLRADVINYNHSDFPDYERIDKQRFLDDFDRFEGLHDTDTLIVRFQNGLDPENIARSLIYLDTGDEVVKNPSDVASAMSRIATTIQDYALISFVDITNDVPSDVMEKDRLEAEFFAGRQQVCIG